MEIKLIPSEMLKLVPRFGGDKRQLNLFLRKCEYIITAYQGNAQQNQYVMHCITSRLVDEAAALLSEREDIETWQQFKELLIQHFGDPRSEECVAIELENLKIKPSESYNDFCNRIQSVRSVLISKVNQLTSAEIKQAKNTIYNHASLNVFLYNLPENLIRSVRLKSPDTLEKALEYVLEEVNFYEQYTLKNKLHRHTIAHQPSFKFGNQAISNITSPSQPTNFKPMLPIQSHKFKYGIPAQARPPQFTQKPNGHQPQIGYKFNNHQQQQFGYKPQLGQQFGTQQRYMSPSQFNSRPQQQFGYRPNFNQGQSAYRPLQQQNKQPYNTDISMRTAPQMKSQNNMQPQGFNLNELELTNSGYYDNYESYMNEYAYENCEQCPENYDTDFRQNDECMEETEVELVRDDSMKDEMQNFCSRASRQSHQK